MQQKKGYREEFREYEREAYWTIPRIAGLMALVIVALVGLGLLTGVLNTATSVVSAPGRVVQRTLETDNILYNYEWFKRQHRQVTNMERQAADAALALDQYRKDAGPRASWDFQTTAEYNRLNAVLLGLQQQRHNYAAEYNARARMANRNIFMGGDLPPEVEE